MVRHLRLPACAAVFFLLAGCAVTGESLSLNLKVAGDPGGESKAGLRAAVVPFEDQRSEKERLGKWIDVWGGSSDFQLDGEPGEVTAQLMVDFLNASGWRAELVGSGAANRDTDVIISGKLEALSVEATGSVGQTEITAQSRVMIEARNQADGSTIRMTLSGAGSKSVFQFAPSDAEDMMNSVLTDSYGKLVENTHVEGKVLRLN